MEIMSSWATRSDRVEGRYFSTQGREEAGGGFAMVAIFLGEGVLEGRGWEVGGRVEDGGR